MRKAGKLLVAVVITASCGAGAEDTATPVTVAKAIRAEVGEQLPLTGSTIPRRASMLSPQVAGIVTRVHIDDGSEVSAGDPVVDLDDVLAKTMLDQ
ncbi:MAG: HlyD family secretion protein, partial [Gammaproteobacteria bacterium]|nr:HlyD family secretion protein [Gammaproteobacteria bacterium]